MDAGLPGRAGLISVHRGRCPNCSSAGSVVGWALASAIGGGAVLNAFAGRFLEWVGDGERDPGDGERDPGDGERDPGDGKRDPGDGPRGPADGARGRGAEAGRGTGGGGDVRPAPRLRREAFGGILAWEEPPALLRLDRRAAQRAARAGAPMVGDGAPASVAGALRAPTEVHVALTGRCPVRCDGCYLSAGPETAPSGPDRRRLEEDLRRLAGMGVFEIAFGGGESGFTDDLFDLAALARDLGMVPNLTTSGFGLVAARARRLAGLFGQVNVSLDGLGEDYAHVRGWDGTAVALAALRHLREAGVRAGVNTVLTRGCVPSLERLAETLPGLGVSEWQWLRWKPRGRGADGYAERALTAAEGMGLWPLAASIEARTGLVLRFDCALVPFLAAHGLPPERLAALGVRGCVGGESLWARTAEGGWAACSFADPGTPVGEPGTPGGEPARRWADDPSLLAWRDRASSPPEPCASCPWRAVCRGGCRIVAGHLTGDPLAPDPECPRVLALAPERAA